jgi:hypothetical protein
MQTRLNILNNGQEVQISDLNLMAQAASAADDQVFAELFRLEPFNTLGAGVAAKAILPYAVRNAFLEYPNITAHATVANAGGGGAVAVQPFKAIVGTRTSAGVSTNLANWTDVRTQFYVGTLGANTTNVVLAANASGNPRFDLVYAAVAIDVATANVTRFVKNSTTKVVSIQSLSVSLATTVSLGVVQGTPQANPLPPGLPADAGGTYYLGLAAVRVPNGFNAGSTVSPRDIRDLAPTAPISRSTGAMSLRTASGNNDVSGTYNSDATYAWTGTSAQRSSIWLPPQMVGAEALLVEIDLTVVGHASHGQKSIVDNSTDWRNRFFVTYACASQSAKFASDPTVPANNAAIPIPNAVGVSGFSIQMGQGFSADNALPATGCTVYFGLPADFGAGNIQAGSSILLYVNAADGSLRVTYPGTYPTARFFFWIAASAPYPNF